MLKPTYRRGFIFEQAGVYSVEIVETARYQNGLSKRRRILCSGTPALKALPLAEEMQSKILSIYQKGGSL